MRIPSSGWSLWSQDSLLSIASTGSVLSIDSVGSCASVGSIGSFASLLSIGSSMSTGSVLSVQSRWAMSRTSHSAPCLTSRGSGSLRPWGPPATIAVVGLAAYASYLREREARRRGLR